MSTYKDETAMATYIAGWGSSAWIAGLAQPVKGDPNIKIDANYCDPSAYRSQPAESKPTYRPDRAPMNVAYDDGGWGE